MPNRQSSQVGIRNEIRLYARYGKKFAEQFSMGISGFWYPGCLAAKPGFYLSPRIGHGRWTIEDSWIRDEPQERNQTYPRQADCGSAVQLLVKPFSRELMLSK